MLEKSFENSEAISASQLQSSNVVVGYCEQEVLGNSSRSTACNANEPEPEHDSTSVPAIDDAQSVASGAFLDLKGDEAPFVAPPVQQEQMSRSPSARRLLALGNATATRAHLFLSPTEITEVTDGKELTIERTKKADGGVLLLQAALAEPMEYPGALQSARAEFIAEQIDHSLRQLDHVQHNQCPSEPIAQLI